MPEVLVKEDLPDMVWSVHVDDEIVGTFRESDEGVLAWYPRDSDDPEYLTIEQITERIKSYGSPVRWIDFT